MKPSGRSLQLGLLVAVATWVVGAICIQRHRELGSLEDLAMFDQMLWNAREGRDLEVSISGDRFFQATHHFFEEHFSPVLYLFAWPAGLTEGPEALLLLQALAFALAAFPLFFWTRRLCGRDGPALLLAVAWLGSPVLWRALAYDFHMEAAEGLFLFACLLAVWERRRLAWLWASLYCACKEDAPLYLAAVGFALLFDRERRRAGAGLLALGLAWFVAARFVIIPAYSASGHYAMANRLITPDNAGGMVEWLRAVLLQPDRWTALLAHAAHTGGLALLGGVMFLPFLGAAGLGWLSRVPEHALLGYHYALPVYPLLFAATAIGAARLLAPGRALPRVRSALAALLLLAGLAFAWRDGAEDIDPRSAIRVLQPWPPLDRFRAMIRDIPPDASVAATADLVSHAARRERLHLVMPPFHPADWLILRTRCSDMPQVARDECEAWLALLENDRTGYRLAATDGSTITVNRLGRPDGAHRWIADRVERQIEAEDLFPKAGRRVRDASAWNGFAWHAGPDDPADILLFGPYRALPAGDYVARFRVRSRGGVVVGSVGVTEARGQIAHAAVEIPGDLEGYREVAVPFTARGVGGLEMVVRSAGRGDVWIDRVTWYGDDPPAFADRLEAGPHLSGR